MAGFFSSSEYANRVRAAGSETVTMFARSKLALNGLLLLVAGFFGIWGALTLKLQSAIISAYVMLFGVMLIGFSAGMGGETLPLYFGFMYNGPKGQLAFLLVAGNLAWSTGVLGIVAAAFANFTAFAAWCADLAPRVPARPRRQCTPSTGTPQRMRARAPRARLLPGSPAPPNASASAAAADASARASASFWTVTPQMGIPRAL